MKTAVALFFLALEASAAVSSKVVPMDYVKQRNLESASGLRRRSKFSKRASTINVALGNAEVLYYANVTVGSPGQFIQLQLDTGSSDVWMTDSSTAFCEKSKYNCQGGTFTPGDSSTYTPLSTVFNITYVDESGSLGHYFTDDFTLGGITLTGLQMGLATSTTIGTGIIGVSFAADEAVCNGVRVCSEYPSIVEQMVTEGKINSQAYSLWLNDLDSDTGSILFGGIDTDKYSGSLTTLPILEDAYSGAYTSFSVEFSGLTSGSTSYTSSSYSAAAILDSGTTLTLLPDDIFTTIANDLGASYNSQQGAYLAPCANGQSGATYDFQFGGSSGPIIKVPVSEFFISLTQSVCQFGLEPAGEDPVLFGDTFLRSAYVVYDLANKEISIAQTNFDSTTSNIQAIQAGANGVPDTSGTAGAATISQTATAISSYGVAGSATATSLTGVVSSTHTGSAIALGVPGINIGGVVTMGLASLFALLGSCLIFL